MITLNLQKFLGKAQTAVLVNLLRGEEGEHFREMLAEMDEKIKNMPKTYETDGMGDKAPVTLHYFLGGHDWYIIEKDSEDEQLQAFGYVSLQGGYPELGYINIEELLSLNVELDLYWTPTTLEIIKKRVA